MTLELITGKDYLSFSAVRSYANCSEQFRLERVIGIRTQGSWAMVAGNVFHTASEKLDKEEILTPEAALEYAWEYELRDREVDRIREGKRETRAWWEEKLLGFLQEYVRWRDDRFWQGWSWLELNGKPAVEFSVRGEIGGVPALGYVDRAMVSPEGEVFLVDIKTGRWPAPREQLDAYALLMHQTYDLMPSFGQMYAARKAEISDTYAFDHSPEHLNDWFKSAVLGIENAIFLPNPSQLCGSCEVQPYCSLKGDPNSIAEIGKPKEKGK